MIKTHTVAAPLYLAFIIFTSSANALDDNETIVPSVHEQHFKSQTKDLLYSNSKDPTSLSYLLSELLTTSELVEMAAKGNSQYIVVLKDNSSKTPMQSAEEAKVKGAQILYIYDSALKGFAIKVPSEKVLEAIIKTNPNIEYVEPDMTAQAHQNS